MPQMIDKDADVVYCVLAMGSRFYCEKRSLVTNVEVVQVGPMQIPKLNMLISEAWTSALNQIKDVTIHGDYVAYPEMPPFWSKRDIPKRATEPTSSILKL